VHSISGKPDTLLRERTAFENALLDWKQRNLVEPADQTERPETHKAGAGHTKHTLKPSVFIGERFRKSSYDFGLYKLTKGGLCSNFLLPRQINSAK